MLKNQEVEAQQTLVELFSQPFKLSAYKVESIGHEEYIVRFRDNRLRLVDVSWPKGQSFKDVFRAAVLERVKRPLMKG